MAETKITEPVVVETTETVQPSKGFWDRFSKPIIFVGSAIIILIGAWYGYKKFIAEPKEREANELVFAAESLFDKMATAGFNKDSVNIVINGGDLDGQKITGVLKVISNFGGTSAGDRAKYMAGASYLHIKEFDKAVKYLKDFDGNGASQVQSKAFIMLGHAYAEQKKTSDALAAYKKAASVNEKDEFFASDALLIAAAYAGATGNNKEAISLYEQVKSKYPSNIAVQNGDVDKNLARLGVVK
ncbi:MAG: tetratricopeptide repeat protein [Sphingobacteriales bacterium]|nr:MAG: tetratricopeptide repeat protein [Sphingobacteriales bacterium]